MPRSAKSGTVVVEGDDVAAALHDEIHRLPERDRSPIILCDLGSLTHEQAARQLGLPVGTVKSRLARGRERLRGRLIRRGLAPSAAMTGGVLSAEAAVPSGLVDLTVHAAMRVAASQSMATGAVEAAVAALAKGVIQTMILSRVSIAALCLIPASFVVIGAGVLVGQEPGAEPSQVRIQEKSAPGGTRPQGKENDPAAKVPREELVENLKNRLVEIARRRLETQKKYYEVGRITIDRYLDASEQLMGAERLAGATPEARIAAVRAHLDRTKAVEGRERAELAIGNSTPADVVEAEERRIRAELELKNIDVHDGPRDVAVSDRLREERELLLAQLEAQKAELRREEARLEMAYAVLATNMLVNTRRPGAVSKEELRKSEAGVQLQKAQVEIERAEVRELELRLDQAKRGKDDSGRVNPSGSSTALERRLREVERKLEQVIETLDGAKGENPRGSFPPQRR